MLRRIRGLLGMGLLWSLPWALAATGLALVLRARGGYQQQRLDTYLALIEWPAWAGGSFGYLATRGGMVGVLNGLLLAGAVMIVYRRGVTMTRLKRWHFAVLGSLATGAVSTLMLGLPTAIATGCAAVGAVSGAAYLALAQRSARRHVGSDDQDRVDAAPNQPSLQSARSHDRGVHEASAYAIL